MTMTIGAHPSQNNATPVGVEMWPVAFRSLSGWLHQRQGVCADTGVVLISPLGRDERCAHMPMRLFAERLAGAGYPTLRYDHLGEGDSLALPGPGVDAMPHWLKGVEHAIALLRKQTGVQRVVLGGVRLGASLATLASSHADGLILLAPVLSGRSWLRRSRFSSGAAGHQRPNKDGALDTDGLDLAPATVASLSDVDLLREPLRKTSVFLAAQNKLVGAYAASLAKQGLPVAESDFPGFETLFLDAHSNLPPDLVFDRASRWLQTEFPQLATRETRSNLKPSAPYTLRPPGAIERPVEFGEGLRGVLCESETPAKDAPAVLFFNTGGDPRCGIGGFTTKAARQLALQGIASLRFDFAGLGDSPMRGAEVRSHIFETARHADLTAAVELLVSQGHPRVVAAGVCAGAYHGFQLAMTDARVSGLFAVSPVKLVWRHGDTLSFGKQVHGKATQVYARALIEVGTWKRLLSSDVDVRVVAGTVLHRLRARVLGVVGRLAGGSPLRDIDAFARRGGKACFLMGLDDASLDEMETYFGFRAAKLRRLPGADIHIVPEMDHGLARAASRQIALKTLLDWLTLDGARPATLQ